MPLGAVITGANAHDGVQTQPLLESRVVTPPPPETPVEQPDARGLPGAIADGAYGNRPPKRGQKSTGVGKVRTAVERGHNFLAQLGRIARRLDRSARRDLGWVQLAA
jgi:transposase